MTAAERAIAVIEHSRQTHVDWVEYLRDNPEAANEPRPQVDVAGNIAHHSEVIADYDLVLAVLRGQR